MPPAPRRTTARARARALLIVAVAASAAFAASARAASPVRLTGDAKCPAPASVARALRALSPTLDVAIGDDGAPGALRVRLWDDGVRYGAELGGEARFFADVKRRCEERARTLALIVALAADPPSVAVPVRKPAPESPVVAPPLAWRFALEVGAALDATPGATAGSDRVTFGGAARFLFGKGRWSGSVGALALAPAALDFPRARARTTAVPLDASLRFHLRFARFELSPEAGLAVRLVSVAGEGAVDSRSGLRAELGLRAALTLSFPIVNRFGLFLAGSVLYVPSPAELQAVFPPAPAPGAVGSLPSFHVGAVFGVTVRLD